MKRVKITDTILRDAHQSLIATRMTTDQMLPIVEKLAPRGLPILTEKPPGRSSAETEELSRIVSAPNLVAFNRRYMPLNRRFKTIVDAMERPYFAECRFYRHGRTTNEFITSTGIHAVNYMEHLFGPIRRVRTEKRGNPASDTWIWTVWATFEHGLEALMKFFPRSGASVERYEVHSNDVSAFLHSPQTYSTDYPGRLVVHRGGQPVETIEGRDEDGVLANAGFADEYRDFFRCVRSGKPTRSTLQSSIESMRIAEAIERGDEQYLP